MNEENAKVAILRPVQTIMKVSPPAAKYYLPHLADLQPPPPTGTSGNRQVRLADVIALANR